ncbi:hypothetical protein Y032_0568g54 [Ancylostoma ceylanicum]|uniref:Uncharacterized protein n=1 Tax=Ancylostoma ceylanicum TaxID=53326 RepID=A0A016WP80_9BILA|nr:hypothetical protein Y032_0568g54 [Ancylostoma ceylanicum]
MQSPCVSAQERRAAVRPLSTAVWSSLYATGSFAAFFGLRYHIIEVSSDIEGILLATRFLRREPLPEFFEARSLERYGIKNYRFVGTSTVSVFYIGIRVLFAFFSYPSERTLC